jgi:ATP-dependent Zn protease
MLVLARYSARSKAAITELPYSKFLALLSQSPEKVKSLRVSPLSFRYILDGAGPAFTKIVSIESSLLERLVKSGVEFSAVSSPKSVVGALVALGYVWFLWKVTSRMLQGPQDGEAAGKGRDKLRLQAYGNLSFDDVAGQDAAKREVQEVCEMLQVSPIDVRCASNCALPSLIANTRYAMNCYRTQTSTHGSVRGFPQAYCWWVRPAPARPY